MSWHWSATVGLLLASCGGAGRAVPTEVEIQWPDAGAPPDTNASLPAVQETDAGSGSAKMEDGGPVEAAPVEAARPPSN